jgi:glycosyltransferase involved in cell wall biosynthesis
MRVLHIVADGDPGWAATAALALFDGPGRPQQVTHALVTETASPLAAAARARGIPTATRAFRNYGGLVRGLRPRLVETVWELAPDLVHAHGIEAGFAVLPAVRWLDLPFSVAVDQNRPVGLVARLARAMKTRLVLGAAQAVLFGSAAERDAARRARRLAPRQHVGIAPAPIAGHALPQAREAEAFAVVMGRVASATAVSRTLAALRALPATHRLVVLGEGPGTSVLARAVTAAGLEGRVDWPGVLPRDQALGVLSRAALLLDPHEGEGVPCAVLEAAAIGVPVVTESRAAVLEALGRAHVARGAPPSAWAEAAREACRHGRDGRVAATRDQVRAWAATAQPIEATLRAWSAAQAAHGAVLVAELPAGLATPQRRPA